MRTLVFALALLAAVLVRAQSPTYKIGGFVVRETGNPVHGAQVSVFLSQHPERQISCVSGDNGEFLFTGIPAGKYSLQVNYHGWTRLYKQDEAYSTGMVVGPGLDTEHIRFELQTPASIVGSVVDDIGDPVRNASVYLFSRWLYGGLWRTGLKQTKTTANDGSFHFTHLDPGTYYVAVSGRPWYAQGPMMVWNGSDRAKTTPAPPELDMAYPVSYYSGATSADAATPIELQHGSRIQVQFHLTAVPAVHLALEGVDKQADQHITGGVSQPGPGGAMINVQSFVTDLGVSGIAPGPYVLSLSLTGGKNATPLAGQSVNLVSDSVVAPEKGSAVSVSGKVIVEGPPPQSFAVLLEGTITSNQAFNFVSQDGSFQMTNVNPGRYNLRLANTPELYIKSVSVKGGEYASGVLDVSKASTSRWLFRRQRG